MGLGRIAQGRGVKEAGEMESRSPPPRSSGDWKDKRQQSLGKFVVAAVG